jgi:DNA-binding response OmpR family regulator
MSVHSGAILLIDPSDDARALHADALRTAGFDVVSVADCESAVQTLTTLTPELIIVSFDPRTRDECLTFCTRLKEDARIRVVPVLLTSASIDEDDMRRATDLRVLSLIVSPLDGAKLTSAVRGVMAVSEGVQLRASQQPEGRHIPRSA